jgi:hypothetical protein
MSRKRVLALAVAGAVAIASVLVTQLGGQATAASATFVHPGVLVSQAQLDFVRSKVDAGAQPWAAAYQQLTASSYASLSRTPKPRAVVECGSFSNPNLGCTDEREDAIAAYTDALAWYISRDTAYAQKAIQLMDAWSATITSHTNSNAPLQTGWAGSVWPRAAEIIRYTYPAGWANEGRFATTLRNVYLPAVIKGSNSNGNWELTMMEAAVGISVFLDDKADYDTAMAKFKARVPAYHRRRAPQDRARQRPDHAAADRELLAGPEHVRQRHHPGDVPRLHPHRLRHRVDLRCRRDVPHPGHRSLHHRHRHPPALRPGLPVAVRTRRGRTVLAVRRVG